MKKLFLSICIVFFSALAIAQEFVNVHSPDKKIMLSFKIENGLASYSIAYAGIPFIERSPLGLVSSVGDFSKGLRLTGEITRPLSENYQLNRSKVSTVNYRANELRCTLENADRHVIYIIFRLSNSDVAFSYLLPKNNEKAEICTVEKEITGFKIPKNSTTFITRQAPAGTGYENSKPSYEEPYTHEEPVGQQSEFRLGYTFPALFHLNNRGWVLLSETGVDSAYVGTHLSESTSEGLYRVAFPQIGENNSVGKNTATSTLPMQTSWKIITLGNSLKPIVESTGATDVVKPIVKSDKVFQTGRSTWSWIVWQDGSCNYEDQVKYIDLAAALKCEFVLIDAYWDVRIGKEKMVDLINYARSKNVGIILWYNSNGNWNHTPQTPKNKMDTKAARVQEMEWLQRAGVKGLKIDFFGGDKQVTMKLYQDILTDAAAHGLTVNFHGTTLPRGWERMYPNYMTSEAVLASENLIFQQPFDDGYASTATIYPFTRNAVAAMDFGPVFLNSHLSRDNAKGRIRRTTDAFEMATSIVFFSAMQHWGLTPDNLKDKPEYLFDFIRKVPTVWDETRFIEGYPGKLCVIARRKGTKWYVGAINGEAERKTITVKLPMFSGQEVNVIRDGQGSDSSCELKKFGKDGTYQLQLSGNGGAVLYTF